MLFIVCVGCSIVASTISFSFDPSHIHCDKFIKHETGFRVVRTKTHIFTNSLLSCILIPVMVCLHLTKEHENNVQILNYVHVSLFSIASGTFITVMNENLISSKYLKFNGSPDLQNS